MAHKSTLVYSWGESLQDVISTVTSRIGVAFHNMSSHLITNNPDRGVINVKFDDGRDTYFTFTFFYDNSRYYIGIKVVDSNGTETVITSKEIYQNNLYVDILELNGNGVLLGATIGNSSMPPNYTSDSMVGSYIDSSNKITIVGRGNQLYLYNNDILNQYDCSGTIKKWAITPDAIQLIKPYYSDTNSFINEVLFTTVGKNPTSAYCLELANVQNKYYYIWNASNQTGNVPQIALECTDKITA